MNLKHYFRKFAVVLVVLTMLCSGPVPVISHADTKSDYDNNNKELEELRNNQKELSQELSDLNTQLNDIGSKISALEEQISTKQSEVDQLNLNIQNMEDEKTKQYQAMKLRIQFMYEKDNYDYLDILLGSKNLSDLLAKSEYIQRISDYDRNMLKELNNLIVLLKESKITLDTELNELNTLKAEAEKDSEKLKSLISSQQNKIDTNSENIEKAEALALEYERKIQQEMLEEQLRQIQNMQNGSDSSSVISGLPMSYDATDMAMLAAIIECEAGNQPFEGKVAVGSVVINRVNNPRFANTIEGVLYAPYQFSPVASGRFAIVLARGAKQDCVEAALTVLNGNINTNALYFHAYNSAIDKGGTVIGDHVFY
ncbi:MAG: cell wall hydrolase [Eubacteriales bacterium]|nr:cell wall hydrolase [Eubacteriales bacterium]